MYTGYLEEFAMLAQRLNFTAAAASLGMTQPTLSRHMAELERYYGTPLFERGDALSLTYAGEVLFDGAASLLKCEEELRARVLSAGSVRISELHIQEWRYSHCAAEIVRKAAASLSRADANCRVRFAAARQGSDIPESVLSGCFDVGILAHTVEGDVHIAAHPGIEVLPLRSSCSPICFFVGAESPLFQRDAVHVEELRGQTIIVPLGPDCASVRADVAQICEARGFSPIFGATTLSSLDELYCMDLHAGLIVGIEEYHERGFAARDEVHMVRCLDNVTATSYLLYASANTKPLLKEFLATVRELDAVAN